MAFHIVIPARLASTRLPAKPLADVCGKPMIVRVVERVAHCGADETWVATDSEAVRDVVLAAGYRAMMTRARLSMLTWWTIPVPGGTTLNSSKAPWPQRRNW